MDPPNCPQPALTRVNYSDASFAQSSGMLRTTGLSCGRSWRPALFGFLFLLVWTTLTRGQTPEWIWDDHAAAAQAGEVRFFRKTFPIGFRALRAELMAGATMKPRFI